VRLVEALAAAERDVWLIVSSHGWRLLDTESGLGSLDALRARVGADAWDARVTVFDDRDRARAPRRVRRGRRAW
jgi:4-hydroxy-3-polyprenylbenzoate decarboxylase